MPPRLPGRALLAAALLLPALAVPAAAGPAAAPSYAEALALAQANQQLVVIDFFTGW